MTEITTKARRERSPKCPSINLEKALKKAKELHTAEGAHPAPKEVVVAHWGYSPTSSSGIVTVASLNGFGLIESSGSGVKLSNLAINIITDERPESAERAADIKTAGMAPKIHKIVWEHFGGRLPSDPNLRHYLRRDLHFTDKGAQDFIRQFKETLAFIEKQKCDILPGEDETDHPDPDETPPEGTTLSRKKIVLKRRGEDDLMTEGLLPLGTDGSIAVRYPKAITPKNLEMAKMFLDLIAKQMEASLVVPESAEDPIDSDESEGDSKEWA